MRDHYDLEAERAEHLWAVDAHAAGIDWDAVWHLLSSTVKDWIRTLSSS